MNLQRYCDLWERIFATLPGRAFCCVFNAIMFVLFEVVCRLACFITRWFGTEKVKGKQNI